MYRSAKLNAGFRPKYIRRRWTGSGHSKGPSCLSCLAAKPLWYLQTKNQHAKQRRVTSLWFPPSCRAESPSDGIGSQRMPARPYLHCSFDLAPREHSETHTFSDERPLRLHGARGLLVLHGLRLACAYTDKALQLLHEDEHENCVWSAFARSAVLLGLKNSGYGQRKLVGQGFRRIDGQVEVS